MDTQELTTTDRLIAQATYGLWDAAYALKRLSGPDITGPELRSLASDTADVMNQLKRLQIEAVDGILADLRTDLYRVMEQTQAKTIDVTIS